MLLLSACVTNKKAAANKKKKEVKIELSSFVKSGENINLYFAITNETKEVISIIKPDGIDRKEPEFFSLLVELDGYGCFYDLLVYIPELKERSDILTLDPKETIIVKTNLDYFRQGTCDETVNEIKVFLKYVPDQKLFEKETFLRYFRDADVSDNEKESFYEDFKSTYRQVIQSDTILVDLTSNQ